MDCLLASGRQLVGADYQIQAVAIQALPHMELESDQVEIGSAQFGDIQVEARKTLRPQYGAAAHAARLKSGGAAFAVGFRPTDLLPARRFIDILAAAIGQAMHGEFLAAPGKSSVRAGARDPQILEIGVQAEGKAA